MLFIGKGILWFFLDNGLVLWLFKFLIFRGFKKWVLVKEFYKDGKLG